MDQELPASPPGLRPSLPGFVSNGKTGGEAIIKDQLADSPKLKNDASQAQRQPPATSKRPYAAFAADDGHRDSTSETFVSSWLDTVYPLTKRPRRYSAGDVNNQRRNPQSISNISRDNKNNIDHIVYNDSVGRTHANNHKYPHTKRAASEPALAPGAYDGGSKPPGTPASICPSIYSSMPPPSELGGRARSASRSSTDLVSLVPSGSGGDRLSSASLVNNEDYRKINLHQNNGIVLRRRWTPLPPAIQALVDSLNIGGATPTPTDDDFECVKLLSDKDDGKFRPTETTIRPSFDDTLFPSHIKLRNEKIMLRTDSMPMNREAVPLKPCSIQEQKSRSAKDKSLHKISLPVPDLLFGYGPIDDLQPVDLVLGDLTKANSEAMYLPFLLVEVKGDGGSMFACTNQCLGGAASCVHIANTINIRLRTQALEPFNSAVFSIAINGAEARLFVCWRPDLDPEMNREAEYYMQNIGCFAIQDLHSFATLRYYIRNILDWGTGPRLEDIKRAASQITNKRKRENEWKNSYGYI